MTVKVLVVGHGSSYKNYDFIRNFDGKILCADVSTPDLIEHDIIPDYQIFAEISEGLVPNMDLFLPESFMDSKIRKKMVIVHRGDANPLFPHKIDRFKMSSVIFDGSYGLGFYKAVNNVGIYAICFAEAVLKPDEVHLIGLDYKGLDYMGNDSSSEWIKNAEHYMSNRKTESRIIDHSGGNFPIQK